MTTTPAKKHSCRRRSALLSRTHCRALRRRGQQSLRYWKFITHHCTSQSRRHFRSLFAFFNRMRTALGALAFAFWLPAVAHAETFTVTTASDISADDDGQLTLREAIHSANELPGPDTVDFAEELSGEILTLAQGELVITDDLAIDGSSLAEAPIIDADQKSRVTNVTGPEVDLELTQLTLRSGMATDDGSGGARGGGILFDSSGDLTFTASSLIGCSAISESHYSYGGGIHTSSGAITLTTSTLCENSSAGYFRGNGGGISSTSGPITLTNSTVSGNSATGYYGSYGGGIYSGVGAVTLTNSTVSDNYAAGGYSIGGGIVAGSGPCILTNSIIANNFLEDDATDSEPRASDLRAPSDPANNLEVSHCLIGAISRARLEDAKVNLFNITGVDPLVEPLADNGGPTQTHALDPRSPAIDQGIGSGPDQRGVLPVDNPTLTNVDGGTGRDIGAFERRNAFLVSDPGDVIDGDYSEGNCTLREAIDVANADPTMNEIGFLDSLSGQVIRLTQGELIVTDDLLIDGSGIEIAPVIDADGQSRGIHFTAPAGDLHLNQLTLRNGQTSGPNEPGGGILFSSNGNLTISRSTLSGNSTIGPNSHGGGVYSESGSLTLSNSTFSGNSTSGAGSHGGGVASGTASVTLASCTLAENSASGSGGGLHGGTGKLILKNTLIANNADVGTAPDLSAPENPAVDLEISHSLIGNSSGARLDEAKVNQSNLIDLDPLLEPLGDHGGPTQTHALTPGSPAIDQGHATGTDQRGFRYIDDPSIPNLNGSNGSDIGAFERDVIYIVSDASDVVDDDFSDGNFTLREAILLTNHNPGAKQIRFHEDLSGAVIILTPETSIERDSHKGELMISDDLTIDASDLAEAPVIDADGQSRVIDFSASNGDLTLTQLIIRNGSVRPVAACCGLSMNDGGGIRFISSGSLNVNNCILSENQASSGGGIFTDGGTINLTESTIIKNAAVAAGGFFYSANGGAIYTRHGVVSLIDSTVSGNSARRGGGIATESGAVTLRNSTLEGNRAVDFSFGKGGGIHTEAGALNLINSTLSGNSATGQGSGISSGTGILMLTNSIIVDNSNNEGTPDISPPDDPATKLEVSHCLIGNSIGLRLDEAKLNLNNLTDIDPQLAPLADNGGPTWTMLPFPGSPVINAGATTDLTTDQRGFNLIGLPDIGAAEYQGSSDLSRVFDTDTDHDGNAYGVEQALGTDPFLADPNDTRNLLAPTFNSEGQPMLSFGISDAAALGTLWMLERSTDLVTFEEIYRFDGTIHFDFEDSPIDIESTDSGVTITDQDPPAGGAFYRFKTLLADPD